MCEMSDGILVSITSVEKLEFLRNKVVKNIFGENSEFTIGLHRSPLATTKNNNKWFWFGYNNTVFPLGDFKKWEDGKVPSPSASCGFATRETSDNAMAFAAGGCDYDDARPYLCQTKACDSNHFCDLESGVKAATAHSKLQTQIKQRSFRRINKKMYFKNL
uniref:C-type lectin domain-containing protein n=1 Tax=Panagrolaimus superbus TaxID=310955 RepID=A0A914YYW7_9BILA